jgi:hypothetical protein
VRNLRLNAVQVGSPDAIRHSPKTNRVVPDPGKPGESGRPGRDVSPLLGTLPAMGRVTVPEETPAVPDAGRPPGSGRRRFSRQHAAKRSTGRGRMAYRRVRARPSPSAAMTLALAKPTPSEQVHRSKAHRYLPAGTASQAHGHRAASAPPARRRSDLFAVTRFPCADPRLPTGQSGGSS